MDRPSWDEYFLDIAKAVSKRSTCDRRHVGCVLVNKFRLILATGYNGSARGAEHCDDVGHLYNDGNTHCLRTVHAECNAVAQAARHGITTEGCTAYVTDQPCFNCTKLMINAGIRKIVYSIPYHDQHAEDLAKETGTALLRIP